MLWPCKQISNIWYLSIVWQCAYVVNLSFAHGHLIVIGIDSSSVNYSWYIYLFDFQVSFKWIRSKFADTGKVDPDVDFVLQEFVWGIQLAIVDREHTLLHSIWHWSWVIRVLISAHAKCNYYLFSDSLNYYFDSFEVYPIAHSVQYVYMHITGLEDGMHISLGPTITIFIQWTIICHSLSFISISVNSIQHYPIIFP